MDLFHWFFPPRCVCCHSVSRWLCLRCAANFSEHFDNRVSSVPFFPLERVFIACHDSSHTVGKLLYAWKYKRYFEVGKILQSIFHEALINIYGTSERIILVPIPIHKKRLSERGFNQSWELGADLMHRYHFVLLDLIIRSRNTRTQVGLTKNERELNLKDAFTLNSQCMQGNLLDSRVVLIDDIFTSGTTLRECCDVLRSAGFVHVDAFVLHRGTK